MYTTFELEIYIEICVCIVVWLRIKSVVLCFYLAPFIFLKLIFTKHPGDFFPLLLIKNLYFMQHYDKKFSSAGG